jgi:microcystin-dependent protein
MTLLHRFRRVFAHRTPSDPGVSRRNFLAGAAGMALATPMLMAAGTPEYDAEWAAVEERATRFGIAPGTVVDAQGRPAPMSIYDPTLGQITMFGGNFAPRGWALCDGQLLTISQYSALFAILGTTYGGNGRNTFGLPDLRGRFPMHAGSGPGRTTRSLGQVGGQESVTLTQTQMPVHAHSVPTVQVRGSGTAGVGLAEGATRTSATTGSAGGSQPHDNMPPFQAVNFLIALVGVFPQRN